MDAPPISTGDFGPLRLAIRMPKLGQTGEGAWWHYLAELDGLVYGRAVRRNEQRRP